VEESPFRQIPEQRLFPARHAALVVKGMREAVRRGTGRNEGLARLARQGIEVAGKTGTATFGSRLQPDRRPKHAWFACFAPADRPEIVVVVFLEHRGLSGGAAAVPIAARFLDHYFGRERTARREGAARR
jgi:cell division protein FtsI/penicillin-binding protein 2